MIDNTFEITNQIGKGGSSQVFSVSDFNGQEYAIKVIRTDKGYSHERSEHFILRENIVMDRIGGHPNIIKSISCSIGGIIEYQGKTLPIYYHVLELCKNGSLNNFIKVTGKVEEDIAKFHFLQLASAISHLHSKGFAHLDIKLDNVLLDDCFNAKLADLGSAHWVASTHGKLDFRTGTPNYIAPEIENLQDNQLYDGLKADIYSLGVLLHVLLTGLYPSQVNIFEDFKTNDSVSTISDTLEQNSEPNGENKYKSSENQNVPEEILDLLSKMLCVNPKNRLSIDDILSHPWLSWGVENEVPAQVYQEFEARKKFMMKTHF